MFGLIQKMDQFSNGKMDQFQKMDFCQELVTAKLAFQMADKYKVETLELLNQGLLLPSEGESIKSEIDKLAAALKG